jgi:hypothetical protein
VINHGRIAAAEYSTKEESMKSGYVRMLAALGGFILLAGCANPNTNIRVNYVPLVKATGGSGTVVVANAPAVFDTQTPVLWVLGATKKGDGEKVGDVLMSTPPADIIAGALVEELRLAGYMVKQGPTVPEDAPKGVRVGMVKMNLNQTSGVFSLDAMGSLSVSFEIWKDGKKSQNLDFLSSSSNTAVSGKDLLGEQIMQNVVQDLMKQAVPAIIKSLGK